MFGKTGNSSPPAQRMKAIIASGQYFVRITLMTDIPNDGIRRAVEHFVQRDRKIHNAQITCKMSARIAYHIYNPLPYFVRQLLKLFCIELF